MLQEPQENYKTFWEHLLIVRRYIIICLVSTVLFAVVAHHFHDQLIAFLLLPLRGRPLVFLSIIDPILFIFKTDLFVGFIATLPIIAWCIYRFVSPALQPKKFSHILSFFFASLLLLLAALAYGYFVIVPLSIHFLFSVQVPGIENVITAESYINFLLAQLLILGVLFQIPLLIIGLTYFGLLNPYSVVKKRGWVYIVLTVLVGFFVPPDFVSILTMLIPALCVFEVSIILSKVLYKRNFKKKNG